MTVFPATKCASLSTLHYCLCHCVVLHLSVLMMKMWLVAYVTLTLTCKKKAKIYISTEENDKKYCSSLIIPVYHPKSDLIGPTRFTWVTYFGFQMANPNGKLCNNIIIISDFHARPYSGEYGRAWYDTTVIFVRAYEYIVPSWRAESASAPGTLPRAPGNSCGLNEGEAPTQSCPCG